MLQTEAYFEANGQEAWVGTQLDSGAEVNVISERFAVEKGLKRIPDAELPRPTWMSGKSVYCYGSYLVNLRLQDDWGQTRTIIHVFYSIDKEGPPILLGMPAMHAEGIVLDLGAKQWRFGVALHLLQVETPGTFAKSIEPEAWVYGFHAVPVPQENRTVGAVQLGAISNDNTKLPQELEEFADVFNIDDAGKLPHHRSMDHAIETTAEPPYGPLYKLSNSELAALRTYLEEALAKGWIRHSTSPAGAPILFVPKKDGGLRLCVDYRALNKVTVKNRHPLPLISETLDRLSGAEVFSKLDLKDAYHRIRIREGDEWKTAFRTRYGHFEYLVMPFGLTNAPATFQAYINRALRGLLDDFCVVYLDDILIFSQTREEHLRHIREVLARLRRASLFVNPKKCCFFTTEVEFLGFIISTAGVTMDSSRVATIQEWPTPQTYRDVQVFLGFVNYFRRFIHHYSQLSGPLAGLLKGSTAGVKTGTLRWDNGAERAFTLLKEAFTQVPILRHFDPQGKIRIETDASDFAVAGILSQQDNNGHWYPVAFWSRKMIDAERNYETHDQELLAIVMAFKQWRHYCEGSAFPIEVLTDHNNLKAFMNMKELNGRQARWAMKLSMYDFEISHRSGKTNPADAPSRRPDYAGENRSLSKLLPTLQQKLAVVATLNNPLLGGIADAWSILLNGWSNRIAMQEQCERPRGATTQDAGVRSSDQAREDVLDLIRRTQNIHIERLRNPQTARAGSAGETLPQPNRNVADWQLNPVAGTVGCKQLVPRSIARVLAMDETAYNRESASMVELIKALQLEDPLVAKIKKGEAVENRMRKAGVWTFDSQGLLRCSRQLYIPEDNAVREELLKRHHDDPLAGHFGVSKTQELLMRKFYWLTIKKDVKEYVDSCDICQRMKARRHRRYGELQSLPSPSGPWQEITMDFITDLPPSKRRGCVYDAILVVVDRYTKMVRYLPTNKTVNAEELAELFFEDIATRYGCPRGIVSDRGSVFTSEFWSEFCFAAKVKRRLSTAFHPQTDGQTERQNQTLEYYLRVYCDERQSNWANLLPMAEFVHCRSYQQSIGCSPFEAMYGYIPDFELSVEGDTSGREVPAAKERVKVLYSLREKLESSWRNAAESQAKYYNKTHKPKAFNQGDLVLLSAKNLKLKYPSKKMSPKYIGPFRVERAVGTQAYRLFMPVGYRIHPVFHVSLLEPYNRRPSVSETPEYNLPELINDEEEWEVEEILDSKVAQGVRKYKVHWKGWPTSYDEWVPEYDMEGAKELREAYDSHAAKTRSERRGRRQLRR